MKIAFIGTGYVGLVTGSVFADYGYDVYCVDVNETRIKELNNGEIPFYEPGLEELVKRSIDQGTLHFTTDYTEAVPDAEAVFICVGTPPLNNGEVDLTQLISATEMVAKHLKDYTVIAIKSTVPIGVENMLEGIIEKHKNEGVEYEFASVPEFLSEGTALENTLHPDRLVFGVKSRKAADVLLGIHKHISGERVVTDLRSAQMIKYAANSFLAMKVSFANGVANIAERTGANAKDVLFGMGLDKRIGNKFFRHGIGFGGSCFPKDVQAFYDVGIKNGYDFSLLKAVYDINVKQIDLFLDKIRLALGGSVDKKTIGLLGLAFKPDTDDVREAPALRLIPELLTEGAIVKTYDPVAMPNVKRIPAFQNQENLTFVENALEAAKGADALLIVTEWKEFANLNLSEVKDVLKQPLIIDGRNLFDKEKMEKLGFTYISIGQ